MMESYWFLCFIPLAILLFSRTGSQTVDLRLQRVEKKLDAIISHLGVVMNPGLDS